MIEVVDLQRTHPVVIVFKPKDRRTLAGLDKTEIVRSVIENRRGRDLRFFEGASRPIGSTLGDWSPTLAGFDVNHYQTPIVCVRLTHVERAKLSRHPDVDIIEDDFDFVYSHAEALRALHVEGQPPLKTETIPAGVAQILAPPAWGNSQGRGIRVAVLDTGIDSSHPDLAANVMGGIGLVAGTPGDRDDEGHGTFCAGIIGAANNAAGVVGVAPQVSLYAVKVSDQAGLPALRTVIAGLDWCIANHMHVVNMSFGFPRPSMALHLMCKRAWESGVLLVASVGNDSGGEVTYPAALDTVIGVTAIDSTNARYPQANQGLGVDLSAPGVNVLSTGLRETFHTMSGTSAAAPHVAGAAALAWGSHRFSDNHDIFHLLASTARRLDAPPPPGSISPLFGHGRINALAASGTMIKPDGPLLQISGHALAVRLDNRGERRPVPVQSR